MPGEELKPRILLHLMPREQHTYTHTDTPCQVITVMPADFPNAELIYPSVGTAPPYQQST